MHAWQNGTPMLASSGYVARVETELGASCGLCATYCPFGAIPLDQGYATVDAAKCKGCGVCAGKCSQDAISLECEPLEIQKLIARAPGSARA